MTAPWTNRGLGPHEIVSALFPISSFRSRQGASFATTEITLMRCAALGFS